MPDISKIKIKISDSDEGIIYNIKDSKTQDLQNQINEIDVKVSSKAAASDVQLETQNLQNQINEIVRAPESGGDVAAEVAQARVDADGIEYATLMERLDGVDRTIDGYSDASNDLVTVIAGDKAKRRNAHSSIVSSQKYGFFVPGYFQALRFNISLYQPAVIGVTSGDPYLDKGLLKVSRYRCDSDTVSITAAYELIEEYTFRCNEDSIIFNIQPNDFFIVTPPSGVVMGYSWVASDACKNIRLMRLNNGAVQLFDSYLEGLFTLYPNQLSHSNEFIPVTITWTDNYFLNWDSNAFAANSNVKCSTIPVQEGDVYEVSGYSYYGARLVIFRDFLGNKISSFPNSSSSIRWDRSVITVPHNAVEMIVQSRSENATETASNYKNHYETRLYKCAQAELYQHQKDAVWVAVGDSLTASSTLKPLPNYVEYVANALQITAINKGISGTGYINTNSGASTTFISRIPEIPATADIVTFFGSFNDVYVSYTLGSIDDSSEANTFYGKLKKTIEDVSAQCPQAAIGFITPTPWGSVNHVSGNTTYTDKGELYVKAIIEVARMYSIPVLDLFHSSNIRMYQTEFVQKYGRYGTDSTHPNSEAHQRFIAPAIAEFIRTLLNLTK